jgi:hypothetical protein
MLESCKAAIARYASSQGKGPSTVARAGIARCWECLRTERSNVKAG